MTKIFTEIIKLSDSSVKGFEVAEEVKVPLLHTFTKSLDVHY